MKKKSWKIPEKETTKRRYAYVYGEYVKVIEEMNSAAILKSRPAAAVASVKLIIAEVEERLGYEYDASHIYRIIRTVTANYRTFFNG